MTRLGCLALLLAVGCTRSASPPVDDDRVATLRMIAARLEHGEFVSNVMIDEAHTFCSQRPDFADCARVLPRLPAKVKLDGKSR